MKQILLITFLILSATSSFSQIAKNHFLAGGNIGFSSVKADGDYITSYSSTKVQLSPNVGFFILNKLAAGIRLSFSNEKFKNTGLPQNSSSANTTIAPFLRYYILKKDKKVNVFADVAYNYTRNKFKYEEEPSYTLKTNGYSISAGPAVFLSRNVALEFTIAYTNEKYKHQDYYVHTFQTGIGFQIHL